MPATAQLSNHYRFMLASGEVVHQTDVFIIILMSPSFVFDPAAHATLADVMSDQLPTGNGYTQNSKQLTGVSVIESDTLNRCRITWGDATWTASGGSIGPTRPAIIYDDTTTDDTIVGCITGALIVTAPDGESLPVRNIEVLI